MLEPGADADLKPQLDHFRSALLVPRGEAGPVPDDPYVSMRAIAHSKFRAVFPPQPIHFIQPTHTHQPLFPRALFTSHPRFRYYQPFYLAQYVLPTEELYEFCYEGSTATSHAARAAWCRRMLAMVSGRANAADNGDADGDGDSDSDSDSNSDSDDNSDGDGDSDGDAN